jgi:hypothetical protein
MSEQREGITRRRVRQIAQFCCTSRADLGPAEANGGSMPPISA